MKLINSLIASAVLAGLTHPAVAVEISGYVGFEGRQFTQTGNLPSQAEQQVSLRAEPEFYWQIGEGYDSFTIKPYVRVDSADDNRSIFDIREVMYLHVGDDYEIKAGIGKVFWGVTETLHLVDIINQTDVTDSFDGEEKLGQPMVHLSLIRDWGVLDTFILPGFRERQFPSLDGRLGASIEIAEDAQYESGQEQSHVDLAARWSNSVGDWDLGLSWFNGTSREALLSPVPTLNSGGIPTGVMLQAYYPLINQFGLDAQYTYDAWLIKLEAINRSGDKIEDYNAMVGGFEYSFYGIMESDTDIGIVVEYAYDERERQATVAQQNDLSLAARIALNDEDSTEFLTGIAQDTQYTDTRSFFIEGSTRVGESTKVSLDAWFFTTKDPKDLAYGIRNDDFVQLNVEYYF